VRWRSLLPWLLALGAGASAAESSAPATDSAQQVLLRCAEEADPGISGLAALRDTCPDIDAAIRTLQLGPGLPEDWREHVSARALADLGALSVAYAGAPSRVLPAPERLRDIARHLPSPKSPPSMWEQFRRWLKSWLEAHSRWWPDVRRYLSGWHTTPGQAAAVFYSLVALAVLTVVVVVVIELRAAGALGLRRRVRPTAQADQGPLAQEQSAPEDLAGAPERLRPVLLLRRLVAVLTTSQRLKHERDLTCRELITTARFDSGAQRERFAALALLAESGLYGRPDQAPPPQQEAVLADAHGLTEQLLARGRHADR
jgi:hypothetical protein